MADDIIGKLKECNGFDWDKGNELESWLKHNITKQECEEIFFNRPFIVANEENHSKYEERFYCFGETNMKKGLFLFFTTRNNKIRVISARNMSKKEKEAYKKNEKAKKKIPYFKHAQEERGFWMDNDSAEYIDWNKARSVVMPKLKPSTETISLRLPEHLLFELKLIANKNDVPYQSLIKMYLQEKVKEEFN